MTVSTDPPRHFLPTSPTALAGFVAVALARLLTLPRSLWESDELLFARAIEQFDPLSHRPHPPGYPLTVGLGKAINLLLHDPFASLVALSVISSLVGYWALVGAFRRIAGGPDAERVAVAGALLFHLSPAMLVQAPLPMSDPPALMFLSLALLAAARLREDGGAWAALGLGAAASAAIGCRPQLALAVLPMLAVGLWQAPGWRRRLEGVAAFGLASLAWLLPLVSAVGGYRAFLDYQGGQASYVATHDAGMARSLSGLSLARVTWIFTVHPWGPDALGLAVLALGVLGTVALLKRWAAALPLAVLSAVQLAVCIRVMDPADAVRYALPAVLGIAFAATAGSAWAARRAGRPGLVWLTPILVSAVGAVYAGPLLWVRATTPSPAAQAAAWARKNLPGRMEGLLVEREMEPFAAYFLPDLGPVPVDEGLSKNAQKPYAPLYVLSEGKSAWSGAANFEWPDSPAYQRLTRNHFREASLSVVPAGRRFLPVRGVYSWEPSLRGPGWRWLEPDAAVRVTFPQARALAIRLGLPALMPLPANTVEVSVDGRPAGTVEVARGTERTIEVPVQGRTAEIAFRSARSFVPAEAGLNPDSRRLAVQLLAVERIPR
ncbi:MAG: glycosyltransferase family 39 protein [Thermoanaerobaculia bacterium]